MPASPDAPPLIEIEGLSKWFDEGGRRRTVLDGASAVLRRGEIAVLVGRSGSGKSTLLNLVAGLDRPSAGRLAIDGVEVSALADRERTLFRRRRIGFVFQFFNLIPTLTVEENVLLSLELAGGRQEGGRERALALLDAVGLADRSRDFPDRLSGGEQQRVAIARALSHDPPLLLADEPTGNLDLETGLQVLALLDRLAGEHGKTLVMATHGEEVIGLADRVFRIEAGRLVEAPGRRP